MATEIKGPSAELRKQAIIEAIQRHLDDGDYKTILLRKPNNIGLKDEIMIHFRPLGWDIVEHDSYDEFTRSKEWQKKQNEIKKQEIKDLALKIQEFMDAGTFEITLEMMGTKDNKIVSGALELLMIAGWVYEYHKHGKYTIKADII